MARKKEPSCETEKYPFPTRLRKLMTSTGTKQKQLAAAIGVRPQTVSLYVLGQSFPDVNGLTKIANFFNVSADYLLGRAEEPIRDPTIQAVCEFTGLSADAIKFIRNLHGNKDTLNSLLVNPNMNILLFEIYDLAIYKSIGAVLNLTGAKLDVTDLATKILPDYNFKEKIGLREYQLSTCFKDTVDSIVQEIISTDHFRNSVLEVLRHSFIGKGILEIKNLSDDELENVLNQINMDEMLQNC